MNSIVGKGIIIAEALLNFDSSLTICQWADIKCTQIENNMHELNSY